MIPEWPGLWLLQVDSYSILWFLSYQFKSKLMSMVVSNRLLNAGSRHNLALHVVDGSGNCACDILEIAVNGIYLDRGKPPRLGRSFLAASTRIDWLIVCNNPGQYYVSLQTILVFVWLSYALAFPSKHKANYCMIVCCWIVLGNMIVHVQLHLHQIHDGWLRIKSVQMALMLDLGLVQGWKLLKSII